MLKNEPCRRRVEARIGKASRAHPSLAYLDASHPCQTALGELDHVRIVVDTTHRAIRNERQQPLRNETRAAPNLKHPRVGRKALPPQHLTLLRPDVRRLRLQPRKLGFDVSEVRLQAVRTAPLHDA
jgi:hypothetical protein